MNTYGPSFPKIFEGKPNKNFENKKRIKPQHPEAAF